MSEQGEIEEALEKLRSEGAVELEVNENTGEMMIQLTPQGVEKARRIWREMLGVDKSVPDELLDELINAAYTGMKGDQG